MIDTPPTRERFLDSRTLALLGGVVSGVLVLGAAVATRVSAALDRAAWDRVGSALADMPVSDDLLVVRAASRTGDWLLAEAALRLDSAGARSVGVAVDLSVPVAPTGALPQLLTLSPKIVAGVVMAGDSIAWPWFIADRAAVEARGLPQLGVSALWRDDDGAVRLTGDDDTRRPQFTERLGQALASRGSDDGSRAAAGRGLRRLRYASTAGRWHGVRTLPIDSVVTLPPDALRRRVAGATVLLGIDDGSTVPTTVGALPALAILAHDVNDVARITRGEVPPVRDAGVMVQAAWIGVWVAAGAALATIVSLPATAAIALGGIIVQLLLSLWLADARGAWVPVGSTVPLWCAAIAGSWLVRLVQSQRRQRLTTLLFSRFVTPALAADAWSARHLYLQGGRPSPLQLPVTVLFMDLRGFTRFSETQDAAEVMRVLTAVTAACTAVITECGGLVDDFAGDGIKADFGVPVPRTTATAVARDASDAVHCAIRLAATIERLLPPALGTSGTQARIGVHSGLAIAGTIGGAGRLKYTVVGDVVNVAARLQSVDVPDAGALVSRCRIVVSQETMVLLGTDAPHAINLGPLTLSGRSEPVPAFQLQSSTSAAH